MDIKDDKPEPKKSENLFYEMLLEDLKNIESSSKLILDLITPIYRSSKQAIGLLEAIKKESKELETQFYKDGESGPWSNALKAMSERDKHLKEKEWRDNFDRLYKCFEG